MIQLSDAYIKQIYTICSESNKGYEAICPKCGGYAIANKGADKTIRIRCTECYADIKKEVV